MNIMRWELILLILFLTQAQASTVVETSPRPVIPEKEVLKRNHDVMMLGRQIFLDPSLSASGKLACASCHDASHAFGQSNQQSVQFGGAKMNLPGTRAVPSLMYLYKAQAFTEHYTELEGPKAGLDDGPAGGFTLDGRVDTLHEQAKIPILAKHEMGNETSGDFSSRLEKSAQSGEFKRLFGQDIFSNSDAVLAWSVLALEAYQLNGEDFFPFTSKYDAYLRHQIKLSKQEKRGLKLFNDPEKGNCASCHQSEVNSRGDFPLFTDYGYTALAVPRNKHIPANYNQEYYDLGICGPDRKDQHERGEYCGFFKVPTLRNIAIKRTYFHNGAMTNLKKAVEFYVTRDSKPNNWYGKSKNGAIDIYDDLPLMYKANVEKGAPFSLGSDGKPRLNKAEINDIVVFLRTLSDGYEIK